MSTHPNTFTNSLINETSPYLLQHAHNPVNWFPWNSETLSRAKAEDKLLLISIGYSACHWCHVMAHECFEDEETAMLMNRYFINVKVDREERPDVDAVYMQAIQLMTGRGGWPLNCIALPDGRPVYGGTYFPREQWKKVLKQVADFYNKDTKRCMAYADEMTQAIKNTEKKSQQKSDVDFNRDMADQVYMNWKPHFDRVEGGPDRIPKFPLPNNFDFLLRYYYHTGNQECLDYVELSLDKMARGGICDQLGGGFSRYSTDELWKVPHFEKMLYDNAQLVSVYTKAWQITRKDLYKEVVYDTLTFIEREMTAAEGTFYSALDADSDGEEGRYYVWKKEETDVLSDTDRPLFEAYYNMNNAGYWEHGNYILLRTETDDVFAEKHGITVSELKEIISRCKAVLMVERGKRARPGCDDKILISWNGLMVKSYAEAYKAFNEEKFLEAAKRNASFILKTCETADGGLYHTYKNGNARINGYLEDYCYFIEALLSLFEVTQHMPYLEKARNYMNYCIQYFIDHETGFFFFTSSEDAPLISRQKEIEDNVIPSSNSSIARSLFILGKYFSQTEYIQMAEDMLSSITDRLIRYGSSYSNWGLLLLDFVFPYYEVAVSGKMADTMTKEISRNYYPNKIIISSEAPTTFNLLKDRFVADQTLIYVCENQTCHLPEADIEQAKKLIKAL